MKITMGMTTWTEHPVLIHDEQRPVKLDEYAQHFPVVEVDTFFYALPQISTIQNWLATVPPTFQFIVKANQKMTLHQRNQERGELEQVFQQYRRTISPLVAAGQLKTILFQFPPYFDATVRDFSYLRLIREWLGNLPIAVEFRNQTWYKKEILPSVLDFCRELNFTLVAVIAKGGKIKEKNGEKHERCIDIRRKNFNSLKNKLSPYSRNLKNSVLSSTITQPRMRYQTH